MNTGSVVRRSFRISELIRHRGIEPAPTPRLPQPAGQPHKLVEFGRAADRHPSCPELFEFHRADAGGQVRVRGDDAGHYCKTLLIILMRFHARQQQAVVVPAIGGDALGARRWGNTEPSIGDQTASCVLRGDACFFVMVPATRSSEIV